MSGATTHGDGCTCVRCAGFAKGNAVGKRHGSYSVLTLAPRARELRESIDVPAACPSDGAVVDALSMVLAAAERSQLLLAAVQAEELARVRDGGELNSGQRDDLKRLAQDSRGWLSVALRYFESLGLTPSSRARLTVDAALARQAVRDDLERLYGEGGDA